MPCAGDTASGDVSLPKLTGEAGVTESYRNVGGYWGRTKVSNWKYFKNLKK